MSLPSLPQPVKLFVALLTNDTDLFARSVTELQ